MTNLIKYLKQVYFVSDPPPTHPKEKTGDEERRRKRLLKMKMLIYRAKTLGFELVQ